MLNDSVLLKKYSISFADLLRLEECRLLVAKEGVAITFSLNESEPMDWICNDDYVAYLKYIGKPYTANIKAYTLSNAGFELYRIIDKLASNEYFIDVCKKIKNENSQINITMHKIELKDDKIIVLDENDELDLL